MLRQIVHEVEQSLLPPPHIHHCGALQLLQGSSHHPNDPTCGPSKSSNMWTHLHVPHPYLPAHPQDSLGFMITAALGRLQPPPASPASRLP